MKQYTIIGIGSGRYDYGGISVNIVKLLKYMQFHNFNVNGIMFGNKKNLEIDTSLNLVHCSTNNWKSIIEKYVQPNSTIILQSLLPANIINKLRQIRACKIILFIPGIFLDDFSDFYYHINSNSLTYNKKLLHTIKNSDKAFVNSVLSQTILKKITSKTYPVFYFNNIDVNIDVNIDNNSKNITDNTQFHDRNYDIGFIISNATRRIKNINLFLKICSSLPDLRKIIVASQLNTDLLKDIKNCTYIPSLTNVETIETIKNTKILVNTSFFDSGPTTLFEAI